MRVERKIAHDGRAWYTVPGAARLLHTTTARVREIMGQGYVDWMQLKTGGKLLVSVESLLSYEQRKAAPKKPV
jgi:hypothetical protein